MTKWLDKLNKKTQNPQEGQCQKCQKSPSVTSVTPAPGEYQNFSQTASGGSAVENLAGKPALGCENFKNTTERAVPKVPKVENEQRRPVRFDDLSEPVSFNVFNRRRHLPPGIIVCLPCLDHSDCWIARRSGTVAPAGHGPTQWDAIMALDELEKADGGMDVIRD